MHMYRHIFSIYICMCRFERWGTTINSLYICTTWRSRSKGSGEAYFESGTMCCTFVCTCTRTCTCTCTSIAQIKCCIPRGVETLSQLPGILIYFHHSCPVPIYSVCSSVSTFTRLSDNLLHDWLFPYHCVYMCVIAASIYT